MGREEFGMLQTAVLAEFPFKEYATFEQRCLIYAIVSHGNIN